MSVFRELCERPGYTCVFPLVVSQGFSCVCACGGRRNIVYDRFKNGLGFSFPTEKHTDRHPVKINDL